MSASIKEILKLSVKERLEIIDQIWESLSESDENQIPLTDEQEVELNRRLDMHKKGELETCSWEEVKRKIHNEI